jgi:nucleoside 2-deoxyribosyltransferase
MPQKSNCFVIMPFLPELHFMYLYMKQHIEAKFNLRCQRGDSKILTIPILEKILQEIQAADFIIADCSGRNPNVFYELGMAHVLEKPVILITRDPINETPTDIKSFEFIRYELDDHINFFDQLDKALNSIMGGGLEALYEVAQTLFQEFRTDTKRQLAEAAKEDFIRAVTIRAGTATLPDPTDKKAVAREIMPAMVAGVVDLSMAIAMQEWSNTKNFDL